MVPVYPVFLFSSLDASAQCFSYGSNVWCGVKGSRSLWMNILKGIQQGGGGTKWFLCPLYKPVSHPAASPTLVSHKSKAASLCWERRVGYRKGPVCVCVCVCIYIYICVYVFSRVREWGGGADRQKECETENRGAGCEKEGEGKCVGRSF